MVIKMMTLTKTRFADNFVNNKPTILFLDGPDKCGKTTVRRIINRMADNKFFIIERTPASMYVYGKVFGRNVDSIYITAVEESFMANFNVVPIYFEVPTEILWRRFVSYNDQHKDNMTPELLDEIKKRFIEWITVKTLWRWRVFRHYQVTPEHASEMILKDFLGVFK
jgi:hypothetical protein